MNLLQTFSHYLTVQFAALYYGNSSDIKRALLIFYMTLAVIVFSLGFGFYFYTYDLTFGILTCSIGVGTALLDIFFLVVLKRLALAGHFFCLATAVFFTLSISLTEGILSPYVPWLVMCPITAILLFGRKEAILWALFVFVEIVAFWTFHPVGLGPEATQYYLVKDVIILFANAGLFTYTVILIISAEQVRNDLLRLQRLISVDEEQQESTLTQAMQGRELERQRISRELHDGLNNILTAVRLRHQAVLQKPATSNPEISGFLEDMGELSKRVSRMSEDLSVHVLRDFGLADGIRYLASRLQVDLDVALDVFIHEEENISEAFHLPIYRIVQETLDKLIRQADSDHVTLQVLGLPDMVRIMVEADGPGLSIEAQSTLLSGADRAGLGETRDQLRVLGGELLLDTAPGRGLSFIVEIPKKNE